MALGYPPSTAASKMSNNLQFTAAHYTWPPRTLDAQNTHVWTASVLIGPERTSTQNGGTVRLAPGKG